MPAYAIAARTIHRNSMIYGATIIHIVLRNRAPNTLIAKMVGLFKDTLTISDTFGRNVLHVAVGLGLSSTIVQTIVDVSPEACWMKDIDKKLPIHFACDTYCGVYEEEDTHVRRQPSRSTILLLVSAAPSSVIEEDMNEINCIEYAILSEAHKSLVSFLHMVSGLEHRKRLGAK